MSCAPVQICILRNDFHIPPDFLTRACLGPATVRMISENRPDFPLPLHLPPGHVVQQVLDENGVITHVIMSQTGPPPPPPPPPLPPHHHVVDFLLFYFFIILSNLLTSSLTFI